MVVRKFWDCSGIYHEVQLNTRVADFAWTYWTIIGLHYWQMRNIELLTRALQGTLWAFKRIESMLLLETGSPV